MARRSDRPSGGRPLPGLALLGPITPADSAADVARLYGDASTRVLVSRLLHCVGLAVALGFFGLVRARLREEEGGSGPLSAILFGSFVALVPVELVRNLIMVALALRFDDLATVALLIYLSLTTFRSPPGDVVSVSR